jgi:FlgD Ig-like domain
MRRIVLASLVCAMLAPSRAGASLLASESFGYAAGALNGQAGGSGWTGAWVTGQPSVFVVQASSLTSGAGETGGSLFFDGSKAVSGTGARVFRALATDSTSAAWAAGVVESTLTKYNGKQLAYGKPGTTVWFGAAVNGGTAGNGVAGVQYLAQFHFYDGPTTTPGALALGDNNKDGEAIAIGRGNGNTVWNYERTCAHDVCPNGSSSSTGYLSSVPFDHTTRWLVMRFDFASATATNVTTWLDPAPGSTAPANATALTMGGQQVVPVTGLHFNWVEMGGQTSQFSFDEVRFATTFAELSFDATLAAPPPAANLAFSAVPSPFTGATTLRFELAYDGATTLDVLDVRGRRVRSIASGTLSAGSHALPWDGRDEAGLRVAPGVYFARLRRADETRVLRLVRLR